MNLVFHPRKHLSSNLVAKIPLKKVWVRRFKMSESKWFNTSDHRVAVNFRLLKAMSDQIPGDALIKRQMRNLVLEARKQGLTQPTMRQSLIASVVGWE